MGFMGELDGVACGHFGSRRLPSSPSVFVLSHNSCRFELVSVSDASVVWFP